MSSPFIILYQSKNLKFPRVNTKYYVSTVACEENNKQKTLEDKFANLLIFTPALESFEIIVPDTLGIINLAVAFFFEIYAQISVIFAPYQNQP